jgi:hypothetical protein
MLLKHGIINSIDYTTKYLFNGISLMMKLKIFNTKKYNQYNQVMSFLENFQENSNLKKIKFKRH